MRFRGWKRYQKLRPQRAFIFEDAAKNETQIQRELAVRAEYALGGERQPIALNVIRFQSLLGFFFIFRRVR